MAHRRQSRPDSGLGFQVKVLNHFEFVPTLLDSGNPIHCAKSLRSSCTDDARLVQAGGALRRQRSPPSADAGFTPVERIWHILDSQDHILVLAFR